MKSGRAHLGHGTKNRGYLDYTFAIHRSFQSLISYGTLYLSLIIGSMYESGFFENIVVIFFDMMSVRFIKPVYPNTNISARLHIKEKYASRHGSGMHIIDHVTGFGTEKNIEFISFDAKIKIVPQNK